MDTNAKGKTMKTENAIPVERVQELWQAWQTANPVETKRLSDQLFNKMIFGDARKAIGWHIATVSRLIGVPMQIVSEYVRRHS